MELKHKTAIFLFLLLFSASLPISSSKSPNPSQSFIGITIGTDVSDLFSPSKLVSFLNSQGITHIRLYDADPSLLSALNSSKSTINVLLGIPNSQLIAIASSSATAATWVSRHVTPFRRIVSSIAVGDDIPTSLPSSLPLLLPALLSLQTLLSDLDPPIPISTPLPFSVLVNPFPPSQAFFNQTFVDLFILPLLNFLQKSNFPLMLNLYPYYAFIQNHNVIPLDNALFKPLQPSLEEVDPNTMLHYTNVFDAMIDAAYFSMKNLNITDVQVLVTETGWPSLGSGIEKQYATKNNANAYYSNLIKHVINREGTPMHPEVQSSVYMYELFNEDLRPGPVSEKNWGLFYGNGTEDFLLSVEGSDGFLANDSTNRTFCVASDDVDEKELLAALDWACGPGRADCGEIQPGESCYLPNKVRSHASYAFDSYYQMHGKRAEACYFKGAAMVTTTDPSHRHCIFPGSKEMGNVTKGAETNASSFASKAVRLYAHQSSRPGGISFLHIFLGVILLIATCTFIS